MLQPFVFNNQARLPLHPLPESVNVLIQP
jgi:hypothetical protein